MARRDHDGRGYKQHAVDDVTNHFLARGGLSFDFDAGRAPYDYQVAIDSGKADTLVGGGQADLRQSDFMFNTQPGFIEGISTVGSWYIFPETV